MLEVADVFRRYGDAYLQKFGQQMLPSHRRAFYDILHFRTVAMGARAADQGNQSRLANGRASHTITVPSSLLLASH